VGNIVIPKCMLVSSLWAIDATIARIMA
jgi:hypothetical protein